MKIKHTLEYYEDDMFDQAFLAWIQSLPVGYLALLYQEWYNRRQITDREIEEFANKIKEWKFRA